MILLAACGALVACDRSLKIALTREVSPSIVDCELTHLERAPIDLARAVASGPGVIRVQVEDERLQYFPIPQGTSQMDPRSAAIGVMAVA